jgi:hypothetical protein
MTALRYFIPLIIEGNSRGIKSRIFVLPCGKYNCPSHFVKDINELSKKYNIDLHPFEEIRNYSGIMFFVESACMKNVTAITDPQLYKKVILTYMINYSLEYEKYIKEATYVVFPSKFMESSYKLELLDKEKHICLGSPKYDISFNKEEIYKKYNIDARSPQPKIAFIIMPKARDFTSINFKILFEVFDELGYETVTKTRGKDPFSKEFHGNYHFVDYSWYPHDSMDLMYISDLVVNFGSTAIKECVMLKKPIINFDIKPFKDCLQILCEQEHCVNLNMESTKEEIKEAIICLDNKPLDDEFDKSIEKYLFTGNSSKRILDFLGF